MAPRTERHRRRDQTARLPGRWRNLRDRRRDRPARTDWTLESDPDVTAQLEQ